FHPNARYSATVVRKSGSRRCSMEFVPYRERRSSGTWRRSCAIVSARPECASTSSLARKQYAVEPRQYEGRLLHQLPLLRTALGDIYIELYLNGPSDSNCVALYRRGTRVIDDLTLLDHFARAPWNLRYLQGHLDASFVSLTPSTRTGIIYDSAYITL